MEPTEVRPDPKRGELISDGAEKSHQCDNPRIPPESPASNEGFAFMMLLGLVLICPLIENVLAPIANRRHTAKIFYFYLVLRSLLILFISPVFIKNAFPSAEANLRHIFIGIIYFLFLLWTFYVAMIANLHLNF